MDKVALEQVPLQVLRFPLLITILLMLHTTVNFNTKSQQKDKRAKPKNLIKQCSLGHGGNHQTSEPRLSLIWYVKERTPCADISRKFLGPMRPKASNTRRRKSKISLTLTMILSLKLWRASRNVTEELPIRKKLNINYQQSEPVTII
jgi:hypothetical protein